MARDPQTSGQQTPSTPELTASETPTYSKTNTLVITSLPPSFFAPLVLEALRIHFESYGEIHTWAPLRAFARIMVVYYDEEAVELAKETCDNLRVEETDASPPVLLRVFRADPTPLEQLNNPDLLRPPQLEKNFLISPPGSPPVGWEQIREEPPNNTPLADDLMVALRKLQIERDGLGKGGIEILIEPDESVGISICVEDCSTDEPQSDISEPMTEWAYGLRGAAKPPPQMKPTRTAMPPLRAAS
ncbi:Calcipressin [Trametopsis cervina]|nr:Calcipressin [Trametopsis cervina]